MNALTDWLVAPVPGRFPYDAVLDEFHRVGKHFVSDQLLKQLAVGRDRLGRSSSGEAGLLERFLDTALDKWDGRYDYSSYTALAVLDLPADDHDRLVGQLLADLLRFELSAAEGNSTLLPDARLVEKRCRLGIRLALPALARLGHTGPPAGADPIARAAALWEMVDGELLTADERQVLRLSMLPVSVSHDEYLFIRVLQTFEATFALLVVSLRAAIDELTAARVEPAVAHLALAENALTESAPLFSLLATMRVEAFRTFRRYTEGASAIQSRNYKLVESLCRTPDADRLDSAAYHSTPEVRDRILAGQVSLDDACAAALGDGRVPGPERLALTQAMTAFAAALRRWRQTHYRIAVRMLGSRPGTGYTEGTPYLDEVRKIPVFDSVQANSPLRPAPPRD